MEAQLSFKETFARFLKSPDRETFRELLRQHTGEYDHLDFKEKWEDKGKLAKHILAFANSGGGCIVIGVAETKDTSALEIKGLKSLTDKTETKNQVKKYLPPEIAYEIHDFSYESSDFSDLNGKSFQILIVNYDPLLIPLLSLVGGTGIERNRVYVRQGNSSDEADHGKLQELISERIKAESSEFRYEATGLNFREHLSQLHELYVELESFSTQLAPYGYRSELLMLISAKKRILMSVLEKGFIQS